MTEIIRRPGVLFSLVLGPFLIMALFGVGYSGQRRPLETGIVIPPGANLPTDAATYQEYMGPAVRVVDVTTDIDRARERLYRDELDMVVVSPSDVEERFLRGEQSVIGVEYNQIDPVRDNYVRFVAHRQVQELNRAKYAGANPDGPEELAWSLVVDSMIFSAEAEVRWLDHTEQRLGRHPHRTMGLELSTETPKRGRPAKSEAGTTEAVDQ